MRNVIYNQYVKSTGTKAGYITTNYPFTGLFLEWGLDSDDGASYTVALVELPDGTVDTVIPTRLKFCVAPDPDHQYQRPNNIPSTVGGGYNQGDESHD